MMNNWVYAGFDETYKMMGVDFDKIYYESQTYLEGKGKVLEGLDKGIFYRREDGSVWADLTKDGLDEKLLLRADGTSVYMTQDIGTAKLRFRDYPIDKLIYSGRSTSKTTTSKCFPSCWTNSVSSGAKTLYISHTAWWNCLTVR